MTNQEARRQAQQRAKESEKRQESAKKSGLQTTGGGGWSTNGPMPSKRPVKPNAADFAGEGGLPQDFKVSPPAEEGVVWEIGQDMIPRRKK